MSKKKILLFSMLIIFIPFIIVNLFIKKDDITFNYTSNKMVRVKKEETGEIIKVDNGYSLNHDNSYAINK